MKRVPTACESHLHLINWEAVVEVGLDSGEVEAVGLRDPDCVLNERVRNADTLGVAAEARNGVYFVLAAVPLLPQEGAMELTYRVAGIDVHKKMLAVVVTDVGKPGEYRFERRTFGTGSAELCGLVGWLTEQGVREAVMESTAQYWRPVWQALEGLCQLHLAQAHSNRAPKGRKRDFEDAERLVRRHVAGELILSFVPDEQQRLWRIMTRTRQQLTRDRIRLRNQMEGFLEESRIKLSSHVSDLFGVSGKRMLQALAEGASDPAAIAALAGPALRASQEQLADALSAATTLLPLRRQILQLFLERLQLIDSQREVLAKSLAEALQEHQSAVTRLAETPGLGVDSAQQIIAEVGPQAASFDSPGQLASWVGCSPGRQESAEVSKSDRSPKGNRQMRRILNQAANAAVKAKGSVFQDLYRRLVPRLGHAKAIWAVAHKLCRIVWKILHDGIEYQERGLHPDPQTIQRRVDKLVRHLRRLGYQVQLSNAA
jgi:transposase